MKAIFLRYYLVFFLLVFFISCSHETVTKKQSKAILTALKLTDRISSNHYSELVKDSIGNAYIACFQKKEDRKDYILISKTNPDGSIAWELGNHNRGRATAITINERNNILVAGWFHSDIQLGDKSIVNTLNGQSFIAEITPDGKCITLEANQSDGIFNIHCNASGEYLVSGVMSGRIAFDTISYENEDKEQVNFVSYFNKDGVCQWIDKLDAQLMKIRSHKSDFYLTGRFNNEFVFGMDTLKNGGVYDNDGFLLKINSKGESEWSKAFGTKGLMDNTYFTEETGCDIAFDNEGNVLVCALIHESPTVKVADVTIITYSSDGAWRDKKTIVKKANNTIFTLTQDSKNNYWLTGSTKNTLMLANSSWKLNAPVNAFVLKLNPALDCEQVVIPNHGPNTLFRSAYFANHYVSFTGHYKNFFTIEGDSIANAGINELFMYSIPLD